MKSDNRVFKLKHFAHRMLESIADGGQLEESYPGIKAKYLTTRDNNKAYIEPQTLLGLRHVLRTRAPDGLVGHDFRL